MTVVLSLILLNLAELSRKLQNLLEVYMYTQYNVYVYIVSYLRSALQNIFHRVFLNVSMRSLEEKQNEKKAELRYVIPDGNRQM